MKVEKMAKKPKRKVKRKVKKYAGKTEKEWRDWGEKFGKRMDQRAKEFAEEVEDLGERFGKRMEGWWFRTFGFIGPLIGSIFGLICLAVGIWVLNMINLPLRSSFILAVSNFLFTNLHLFFGVFLFFGYSDYFSKRYPKTYWMISPITTSIGIVIVIWISVWILNSINTYIGSSVIESLSNFLYVNVWGIFVLFLVLGYAFAFIKRLIINMLRF